MTKYVMIALCAAAVLMFFNRCGDGGASTASRYKPLNVTILLDLSDRIQAAKHPYQAKQDREIILSVVSALKANCEREGAVFAKDKIKVVFYPSLYDEQINHLSYDLAMDLSAMEIPGRKQAFDSVSARYELLLEKLYERASSAGSYNGSDIFSYFRHRVASDCIDNDTSYANILVIVSDGYMYSADSKFGSSNRFSYILKNADHFSRFLQSQRWREEFNAGDYGFIPTGENYGALSVIGCEFAPTPRGPMDFDVQSAYWGKWFGEMGIPKRNYLLLRNDFAMLNTKLIYDFILRKGSRI